MLLVEKTENTFSNTVNLFRISTIVLKRGIIANINDIDNNEKNKNVIFGGNLLNCISIDLPLKYSTMIIAQDKTAISKRYIFAFFFSVKDRISL